MTRHQVQEAAVHHWDAVHAAGSTLLLDPAPSADSVEEFLHFSVASDDDPDEPTTPPLAGVAGLPRHGHRGRLDPRGRRASGDGEVIEGAREGAPAVEAPAADLLLWLYGRVELDTAGVPDDLVARFRGICFTD